MTASPEDVARARELWKKNVPGDFTVGPAVGPDGPAVRIGHADPAALLAQAPPEVQRELAALNVPVVPAEIGVVRGPRPLPSAAPDVGAPGPVATRSAPLRQQGPVATARRHG